jgi:hypothetical protein
MRIEIVGLVAALGFSVSACASTPRHDAGASEVPMYTNAEWAQMNSESSVAEIQEPASSSPSGAAPASLTGYSGNFGAFDNYGSGVFRSYGGGTAVHGAIAGTSNGASAGGFSAGHAAVSSSSHASSGGHAGGGHGGR